MAVFPRVTTTHAPRPRLGLLHQGHGRRGRQETVDARYPQPAAVLAGAARVLTEPVAFDVQRGFGFQHLDRVVPTTRLREVHNAVLAVAAGVPAETHAFIGGLDPHSLVAGVDTYSQHGADIAARAGGDDVRQTLGERFGHHLGR